MPGRVFRVRRRVDERQPVRIRSRVRIAVRVRQRDRGHRPPGHFVRNGAVESLAAPGRERRVGHRDVQDREKPVAVGHRQVVGARDLVRGLIPVDAGVALPERRERRLVLGARRSGSATERLDGVEIVRVRSARQTSRWSRLELGVVDQDEHRGECQPLRAHRSERRRRRPPLADRGPTGERRVARAEPIGRAPGEHGLRDLGSPGDAALDTPRARAPSSAPIGRRPRNRRSAPRAKPHSWHRAPAVGTGTGRPAPCTPQR